MTKKITIAIDGFSSCGKSTMAKNLAKMVDYIYVDTGAMYRAVTLYCMRHNLMQQGKVDENQLHEHMNKINVEFKINMQTGIPETYLNNENVETAIRNMDVSNNVSAVSAIASVRKAMTTLQQKMGEHKGIVMDGRDVGTMVFPDAELKIFVTADTAIRAQRRYDELQKKGDFETSLEEVLENIMSRDYQDQTRKESPLVRATDAIVLDNSYMTRDEQMQWLLNIFNQKTSK